MAIKCCVIELPSQEIILEKLCEQALISVGRSKSCNLTIDNPEVSRRHFLIKYINGAYYLIDEGSRNGVILNQQKIETAVPYKLHKKSLVEIPGIEITLEPDQEEPKVEKTTIMARKMMGELLEGQEQTFTPTLKIVSGDQSFLFEAHKNVFSLGSHEKSDFVLNENHIAKEHLTFIRDITGIKIIPVAENVVRVNEKQIKKVQTLEHGDRIILYRTQLVFFEKPDKKLEKSLWHKKPSPTKVSENSLSKKNGTKSDFFPAVSTRVDSSKTLMRLDRIFIFGFAIAALGLIFVLFQIKG